MLLSSTAAQGDFIGTRSASDMAPAVNGADIANLGVPLAIDAAECGASPWNLRDIWTDTPAQGQTFTTGSNAGGYDLHAITLQNSSYWGANGPNGLPPMGTWIIQIGTVSGSALTPIATGSVSNGMSFNTMSYITVTFDSPIHLSPNTLYGFDWGTVGGVGFNTTSTVDAYAGGIAYHSGANGVAGNGALSFHTDGAGLDRVFHLDMTAVPEPSAFALAGLGLISLMAYAWRKRK